MEDWNYRRAYSQGGWTFLKILRNNRRKGSGKYPVQSNEAKTTCEMVQRRVLESKLTSWSSELRKPGAIKKQEHCSGKCQVLGREKFSEIINPGEGGGPGTRTWVRSPEPTFQKQQTKKLSVGSTHFQSQHHVLRDRQTDPYGSSPASLACLISSTSVTASPCLGGRGGNLERWLSG